MTEPTQEPCGNEFCDRCDPRPRFKIVTERVQRLFYTRTIKAADANEALRIYAEGTAWPTQYDDDYGEVLEKHEPVVTVEEPRNEHVIDALCYHNLPSVEEFLARGELATCDFVGDSGCSDEDCHRCHPKPRDYVWPL